MGRQALSWKSIRCLLLQAVFERMEKAGGCLAYAIPAYRLPKDIVERFVKILEKMGIEFKRKTTIGENGLTLESIQKDYDAVMLDTGVWKRPLIGIAGEELTRFGLDFLVDVNNYMHARPGANVVVVGGGNVAVDVAVTAKRLGAKKVTMICLEPREKMPAGKEEIERVLASGCDLMNGWGPKKVNKGAKGVSSIEFKSCTQVFNEAGRFAPQYDDSKCVTLDTDVVFMAVGQSADLEFLEGVCKVETERGRIKATEGNETNIPGVFAGGDITTGAATVIMAIASGKDTAKKINSYLGQAPLAIETEKNKRDACACGNFLRFNKEYPSMVQAHRPEELPLEQQAIDKEDVGGLNLEEVRAEADRCLNCGCVAVNPSDMQNMLIALGATVRTNMRSILAEELFCREARVSDVLNQGEILLEIEVPKLGKNTVAKYLKFRLRDSIDFAVVAVAWMCVCEKGLITEARLVLGAVAPVAFRAKEAEEYLVGKELSEEVAEEAARIALRNVLPMPNNSYKIDILKAYIKRAISK